MKKIFLLLLIIFTVCFFAKSSSSNKEGFESYTQCVEQGYPLDFCVRTPIQSKIDTGYCSCAEGYFGSWHMDDNKCYCYLSNGLIPQKFGTPFYSSPF